MQEKGKYRKERISEKKEKKETRNVPAQESIKILVLPNEPNFKWKLPPECLLTSEFSDPSSFSLQWGISATISVSMAITSLKCSSS